MTSLESAETTRLEVDRIRAALARRGWSPERVQAASVDLAARMARRGASLQERIVSPVVDRVDRRSRPRLPRGLVVAGRTLGTAWAALMLSTLVVAIVSRTKALEATAALDPAADDIRLRTALGPMAFTSRAPAFRSGIVDCWYGGGFVDLRAATLHPDGAVLKVRAVFGGGQIVVPETWRVTARVRGIGGLHDGRPRVQLASDAPHLTIEGIAVFGGFAVTSELSEADAAELEKAVARQAPTKRRAPGAPAA